MLSKSQFAALMQQHPDKSEDEILELAREAAPQQSGQSVLGNLWEKANAPLTDAPSKVASKVADVVDHPSLDRSPLTAKLDGFKAGAIQGAGDLLSSLTSPVNLALTLLGAGGEVAGAKGLLGISKAARAGEAALQAPMVVEGAKNAAEGFKEGDYGKAGAGALEALGGGLGAKHALSHSFPVGKVAEGYAKQAGIPKEQLAPHKPVKVNPEEAKAVADAYQAMPHNPSDPETAASYKALQDEVKKQFLFVKDKAGLKMTPSKDNYASSKAMIADILGNNELKFYPSEEGFGSGAEGSDHPLLQVDPETGLSYNDMFRAIHDYFGHAKEGHQFGPSGEENAWLTHVKMFSPEAAKAMTSETRGQNSWVNSGPHLRNADGNVPTKGQPGYVPPQARPFAEQKAGLLPEQFRSRAPQAPEASGQTLPAQAAQASSPVAGQIAAETSNPTKLASSGDQSQGVSPSSPRYQIPEVASIVEDLTNRNDGASFNLYKGDLAGTPHYSVSPYKDYELAVPGKPSRDIIERYAQAHADLLADPKHSLGTWFNPKDGKTYLDISVTTPDLKEAATLGKAAKQQAIFDLGKFETISLEPHPTNEFLTSDTQLAEPQRPTFKDPMEGVKDTIAAQGGRNLQRVAKEQAAKGLSSTAMAVASPAAAMAIPDDPDSEWDDYARVGLMGMGVLGALGHGKEFFKDVKPGQVKQLLDGKFGTLHPKTGRVTSIGLGAGPDNLRPAMTTQGIPKEWEREFRKAGLKNGTPPPAKPFEQLVELKNGKLQFNKEVQARLRTLYRFGEQKFKSGGAEWEQNGILNDMLKFLPIEDADVASHRLFGALSPAQEVPGNLADMLKVALRARLEKDSTGAVDTSREHVTDMMKGIGNRPSKAGNVERALKGEPLQSYAKPDPMPEGKTEDLAKGMAGKKTAIPFDMWWARALGSTHDAQPANGLSYKLLYDAGAKVAKSMGVEPFPFMAKVWSAMKDLHSSAEGGVAPNELARNIGLGQADLFEGSTTPRGQKAKEMLRSLLTGGADLLGPTGVSERATTTLKQDADARNLLDVANKADFKGLRVFRPNKVENALDKKAYNMFVTNRPEGVSLKDGQKQAQQWVQTQLGKLKQRQAGTVEKLGKHLEQDWLKGTDEQPRLPMDADKGLLFQRIEELLDPATVDKQRLKTHQREVMTAARKALSRAR